MVKPRAQEKVTAAVGRSRPDRPTCQDALPALIEVVAQNHINEQDACKLHLILFRCKAISPFF